MTDPDNSYRPRSPDFSSFQGSLAQPSSSAYNDSYHHPTSPGISSPLTPQASYDASPFFNPQVARQQYFPPQIQQQQQQQYQLHQYHQYQPQQRVPQSFSSYQSFGAVPPIIDMPPRTRSRTQAAQPPQIQTEQQPQPQPQPQQEEQPHLQPHLDWQLPTEPPPDTTADPGPSQGIEIKTKFPVARIKRIMQADEDVGKVAQVTPIAVSKALELFMISLVTKASQQAKDRSSKRVTAVHLKDAIAKDDVLDFLGDIIAKVPDQSSGGGGRNQEEDGSDQNQTEKRKRGGRASGGGRRKKGGDDDDQ